MAQGPSQALQASPSSAARRTHKITTVQTPLNSLIHSNSVHRRYSCWVNTAGMLINHMRIWSGSSTYSKKQCHLMGVPPR